jgi:hypothetical protein
MWPRYCFRPELRYLPSCETCGVNPQLGQTRLYPSHLLKWKTVSGQCGAISIGSIVGYLYIQPLRKLWNAYRYLRQSAYRWNAYRYLCRQCINRCVLMYRDVLRPVWRAPSSFAASAKLPGISNALVRFVIWPRWSGAPEICDDGPFIGGEAYASSGTGQGGAACSGVSSPTFRRPSFTGSGVGKLAACWIIIAGGRAARDAVY